MRKAQLKVYQAVSDSLEATESKHVSRAAIKTHLGELPKLSTLRSLEDGGFIEMNQAGDWGMSR